MSQREMKKIHKLIKEVRSGSKKLLKQDGIYAHRDGRYIALQRIAEADLSRIVTDYMEDGFIIITSDRTCEAEYDGKDCTEEQEVEQKAINQENLKMIKKMVRSEDFGYVPVLGGYRELLSTEPGEPKQYVDTEDPEDSLLVHSRGRGQDLKALGVELAQRFNQDSFFYKPPKSIDPNAYYIDKNGSVDMTFTNFKYNDISQIYYTQLAKKPHRRFTAIPESFQFYLRKHPASVSEARRRYGETFFNIKKSED
jgi:hypothetical protein